MDFGYGADDACVVDAHINGAPRHVSLRFDEAVRLALDVRVPKRVRAPQFILDIMDGKGLQISGRRVALPLNTASDIAHLDIAFRATLQKGVYRLRMRIVDAPTLEQTTVLSRQEGWLSFDVVDDSRDHFTGLFPMPMDIAVRD